MTADDIRGFRLSPQQRRLWSLAEGAASGAGAAGSDDPDGSDGSDGSAGSDNAAPCAALLVRIDRAVTAEACAAAIAHAAARHEVLRTVLRRPRDMRLPVQVILERVSPAVATLPPVDAANPRAALDEICRAPFDPATGPLVRAALETHEDGSVLALAASPYCLDLQGLLLLAREVGRALVAAEDTAGVDGEEPLQYADLAEWQNAALEGEDGAAGREVWRRRLAALPSSAPLPWAEAPPAAARFAWTSVAVAVEPAIASRLRALAADARAPVDLLLLAAWGAFLGRAAGCERLAVGVDFAGRQYDELATALGPFARTLPLALATADEATLDEVLVGAAAEVREAAAWQECFAWAPPDDPAAGPTYLPYAFSWLGEADSWSEEGVRFEVLAERAVSERFVIRLVVRGLADGGLALVLDHDPAGVDPDLARRLAERFATWLADLSARGLGAAVAELETVGPEERRFLLEELAGTRSAATTTATITTATPSDLPIHHRFEERARRSPDALALVAGERLSAAELNERANRLAHHLRRLGVVPEVPVALLLERDATAVIALLAVLKAGGCYVPLDPGQPAERLAFLLGDCGAPVVLTVEALRDRLPAPALAGRATLALDRDGAAWAAEPASDPPASALPENAAYAIFTSGSTGAPKRVVVEHRQLAAYVAAVLDRLDLAAGASFATVTTFAADLGHTAIFPALATGGALHVVPPEQATDPEALADRFTAEPVDVLKIVPSHLRALLAGTRPAAILPRRRLVLGGEAASHELVAEIGRLARASAPELALFNHYGPTEATVGALAGRIDGGLDGPEDGAPPLGRPLAGRRVYVLDAAMRLVPAGAPGELFLGGAGVARGYGDRPATTAERFVPDPFGGAGERLYRTGDLARFRRDGGVEFLGRIDQQVKIHGFRVEPGEVEAALARHPAIASAAVVAQKDGDHASLAAYLVAAAGAEPPSAAALRDFLRTLLPEPMVPTAWLFLPALPLSANGKLDRRALPAPARIASAGGAPRNRAEAVLAQIWREVLGLERIGIHDNFFELGGDSILSIQIIARASRQGLHLTPKQIFRHQTIAALVEAAADGRGIAAEQGEVTGAAPLSPIQLRFFAEPPAEPAYYNQALLLTVDETVSDATLAAAVAWLPRRHDALRLRFEQRADGWHAEHAPLDGDGGRAGLRIVDLSALAGRLDFMESADSAASLADRIEALCGRAQRGFDLGRAPLWRAVLIRLGAAGRRLLLAAHHLVVDGVSWGILEEDLAAACDALARGAAPLWPAKTTSWREFAERLREHATAPETLAELAVWEAIPAAPPLALPVAAIADDQIVHDSLTVALDEGDTARLLREAASAFDARPDELFVAALARTLAGWLGDGPLPIDLEGHGREDLFSDVDLSRTVGWFTTIYPVWLPLAVAAGRDEAVARVREVLRRVPERGFRYGLLRYLNPQGAALAAHPAAPVRLNYLGVVERGGLASASPFARAEEGAGQVRARRGRPRYALDLVAGVARGRLFVTWTWGEGSLAGATVRRLAERQVEELRELARGPATVPAAAATTPNADFALAGLDPAELERVLADIARNQESA